MFARLPARGIVQPAAFFLFALALPDSHGSGTRPSALHAAVAAHSPAPAEVAEREVTRRAETLAARRPGAEVFFGRGDSMLPLYREGTALVVERMDMEALRTGMTVVFIGDAGDPVAHVLVENTPRGWIARGLGNKAPDRAFVRYRNYIGTVIAAVAPRAEAKSEAPALAGGAIANLVSPSE